MSVKGVERGVINDRMPVYGLVSPVCSFCKHWFEDAEQRCAAFRKPFSIPLEIWTGKNKHTKPVPGDHGIRFEELEAEEI